MINALAEEMSDAVVDSPCLRARRCFMLPYEATDNSASGAALNRSQGTAPPGPSNPAATNPDMGARLGFGDPRGCCPGQTGHHLVPDAMMRPGPGQRGIQDNSNCTGYDEKKAPTVCVEGAGANTGSYATINTATEAEIAEKMNTDGSISMERAIQAAADAYKASIGRGCDRACIEEQLRDYYGGMDCQPLRAVNRRGDPVEPMPSDPSNGDFGGSV